MQIVKRLSDTGASEEALQQLETEVGSPLPNDYRRFLAETNGGHPEPSKFVFLTPDGNSDSALRYFLTLNSGEELYTIREYMDRYEDRFPKGVLPIACDSFGNVVLIDVAAKAYGSVYFWDHEKESMDEPTWENVSDVAPSFTAFVDALE